MFGKILTVVGVVCVAVGGVIVADKKGFDFVWFRALVDAGVDPVSAAILSEEE